MIIISIINRLNDYHKLPNNISEKLKNFMAFASA